MSVDRPAAPFLMISSDLIDSRMAGQGIRALELARALAREIPVRLAVPERCDIALPGVEVALYQYGDVASLERAARGVSGVFAEPFILQAYPFLLYGDLPLVVDLYNPFVLEHLVVHRALPLDGQLVHFYENVELANKVVERGDFFTCATERQRDWWLGVLQANGRINPVTTADDPHLRHLIEVVAYGVTSADACPTPGSEIAGLTESDKVILWGGGLWNWLDPLTLLRALPKVLEAEPNARVLFPGTRHPNKTIVPDMEMRREAQELAQSLGLTEREVLFGDWVPYAEWHRYLAAADVAVSFHRESPETRFAALRSRIYGYLGARLPMVVQSGDRAAEIVAQYGLGEVVPPGDPDAAADALVRVLRAGKAAYADHFTPLLESLSWEEVAAPLLAFTRAPRRAPDHTLLPGSNPLQRQAIQQEFQRLRALVSGYENGRVMRLLNALHQLRAPTAPTMTESTADPLATPVITPSALRRVARMATNLDIGGVKREVENYAAWKLPPLRRAAERQWRRLRRQRKANESAPTRLHRLYEYHLADLGDELPALRGIYTPGYRSETVGNYLQQQFTENAEVYAGKYTDYEYMTTILAPVLVRLNVADSPRTTILDIGSGAGNSIFPLLKLCPSAYIIASDLSIQLLKLLRDELEGTEDAARVELLQLNAEELDFLPTSLDMVVGVAVLHHLFEPERALAGCARVLKPGGHALFLEPFAEGGLTLARLYRRILEDTRATELPEAVRDLLRAVVKDYEVRAIEDKTLPLFNHLDDKQLFTRAFFQEQARRHGFRDCVITPIHEKERQYERQTMTFLRLTGVDKSATLPEWTWDIIRAEDATLSEAVPIEACVVLTR